MEFATVSFEISSHDLIIHWSGHLFLKNLKKGLFERAFKRSITVFKIWQELVEDEIRLVIKYHLWIMLLVPHCQLNALHQISNTEYCPFFNSKTSFCENSVDFSCSFDCLLDTVIHIAVVCDSLACQWVLLFFHLCRLLQCCDSNGYRRLVSHVRCVHCVSVLLPVCFKISPQIHVIHLVSKRCLYGVELLPVISHDVATPFCKPHQHS